MKVLMKKMKKYQITRSFAWVCKKETAIHEHKK